MESVIIQKAAIYVPVGQDTMAQDVKSVWHITTITCII